MASSPVFAAFLAIASPSDRVPALEAPSIAYLLDTESGGRIGARAWTPGLPHSEWAFEAPPHTVATALDVEDAAEGRTIAILTAHRESLEVPRDFRIVVIDRAGTRQLDVPATYGEIRGLRILGDLDGDGHRDIGVSSWKDYHSIAPRDCGVIALSGADGSVLWEAFGRTDEIELGTGFVALPDVNGDGVTDVLAVSRGRITAISGRDGATLSDPAFTATDSATASGGLCLVPGSAGTRSRTFVSISCWREFGGQDVLFYGRILAFDIGPGGTLEAVGESSDECASVALSTVGDVDGDGVSDFVCLPRTEEGNPMIVVRSGRDASPIHVRTFFDAGLLQPFRCRATQDVDGDCVADIAVSEPGLQSGFALEGIELRVISAATLEPIADLR